MSMFRDRIEAGKMLARSLEAYRENAVVLALPRGGVVLGREVATALQLPLDIAVPRKIGHPLHPEYAVGAVDEHGTRILNEQETSMLDATWLAEETERQKKEAQRRAKLYREGREPLTLKGKTVILVDDGIATGLTMQLALRSVEARHPQKIVVAVPVAPADALGLLAEEGAETIVLEPPEDFQGAVGAHYRRFEQVTDEEVINLLRSAWNET